MRYLQKIKKISKIFKKDLHATRIGFFKKNTDKLIRLDYELNENSIVFDVGGYEGQWASDLYAMHNCNIYVFEPIVKYAEFIKKRFKKNTKIKVFAFGLGGKNQKNDIALDNDGSSLHKKSNHSIEVEVKDIAELIEKNSIDNIDLIKINIEGGEYELLERLIEKSLINNIKNIQVQFHDFVTNADKRMNEIKNNLKKTHNPTYEYEYVWENWKRINN